MFVPDGHRVREIAAVLDLSWVHTELAPYYSPVDRSSCREVRLNLAYRWFFRLSLEDKIPDHSNVLARATSGFGE
jgi:hypothetical protein